jgi:hypothetical protein
MGVARKGECRYALPRYGASHRCAAFVVSEVNGTWHDATQLPGTAALNAGGIAAVDSVSCASAGNCSAGGGYLDANGNQQAFVVSETR